MISFYRGVCPTHATTPPTGSYADMFEAQVDLPVQQTALEVAIAAELEADRMRPLLANQPEPVFVMEMPPCVSWQHCVSRVLRMF